MQSDTCDYNRLLLYAKGHYIRGTNVIADVKKILAERCLVCPNQLSNEGVWHMCHHALLKYCYEHIDCFLAELFKPRWTAVQPLVWFDNNCPLERAVHLVLTHLARVRVRDDNHVFLELGQPDPKILPLKDPERWAKEDSQKSK